MTRRARLLLPIALFAAIGSSGCSESSSATEPDPTSPEALIGIWESVVAGVSEATLEIEEGGTFSLLDADLGARACEASSGVWSAQDGTLATTTQERNGRSVTEPEVQTSFQRSGSSLTLTPAGDASEVFVSASSLPTCNDYGWMTLVMSAEFDGVPTDFVSIGGEINLESSIRDGIVSIAGLYDPEGLGLDSCTMCSVLTLDLTHELGIALYPGVYPIPQFGATGLRGKATYWPTFNGSLTEYGSNDSEPASQPWQGEIDISTLTPTGAEGTFEFVVYDGDATGPPYPLVTVTNGYFRLFFP